MGPHFRDSKAGAATSRGLICLSAVGLLLLVGCSDDDAYLQGVFPQPPPALTRTPTTAGGADGSATPTASPTRTATRPPATATATSAAATATQTRPVRTSTPTATSTATSTSVPVTPTDTPIVAAELGMRLLTIRREGDCTSNPDRNSCFFSGALGGFDVSQEPWAGGPLRLQAGAPDENGVAPVQLVEDAFIGFGTPLGGQCLKLFAAESSGHIDCDGGSPNDVKGILFSNGSAAGDPPAVETDLGEDGGAGALTLVVMQSIGSAADPADCPDAAFEEPVLVAYTSTTATAEVVDAKQGAAVPPLSGTGQNFDCSMWQEEDGSGVLVAGIPFEDAPLIDVDIVNILQVSD